MLQWINNYRDNRTPARLPVAVQSMSRLGLFRDMDGAGVYVGFIAGVLGDNPAQAAALVEKMFPMPPEEQTVLIRGIAFSGLADWKGLLTKFSERMPARRTLIEKHLADKAETLQNLPLDTGPAPVDTLWGFYFATGSAEPVLRILTALPWSTDTRDVNKLTVGSMAKWTLASNAMREKPLLDLLRDQVERQPKEVQTPLRDVITAAETYEIARIRKEAMNSIEELKRKGPSPTAWGWGCRRADGRRAGLRRGKRRGRGCPRHPVHRHGCRVVGGGEVVVALNAAAPKRCWIGGFGPPAGASRVPVSARGPPPRPSAPSWRACR